MALDKVVDSAVLNADLQAVADAIRAKGGTSGALAFPAGFVSAVEAISAGGGGSGIQSASGIYVLAEDATNMSIDINDIGFVPDIAVVELDETGFTYDSTPTKAWVLLYIPDILERSPLNTSMGSSRTNVACLWRGKQGTNTFQISVVSTSRVGDTRNDGIICIHVARSAASYPIIAGTYKWSAHKIWGDE